ncbi:MAG: type II toxin-antitoxin system VapC family toxin [Fibromonadaceae bacterium]|jgi:predicted nucleic acid-binding protein|nr:type II toxin-antitoxin system VapC family toxin [Fibromonadaceae bacterium]
MEQSFLIDTNIIIDIFKPSIPSSVKSKLADIPLVVSAVTYMEILGWLNATEQQLKPIQEFMNNAKILLIDKPIMETTIKIRQMKKIALGDAIITATALVHNLTLITRNIDDFKNIKDLKIWNPWE